MRLILASASPRRAELLASAGFRFEVSPADVDETPRATESPEAYALRVAHDKAAAASAKHRESRNVILAADTVVVADGRILGKPENSDDARRMLRLLADAIHDVLTAVVVKGPAGECAEVVTTRVRFLPLEDAEIEWYVASGEPEGKAGA
jgi:septum formation protein